jgi:hypothetical protein
LTGESGFGADSPAFASNIRHCTTNEYFEADSSIPASTASPAARVRVNEQLRPFPSQAAHHCRSIVWTVFWREDCGNLGWILGRGPTILKPDAEA